MLNQDNHHRPETTTKIEDINFDVWRMERARDRHHVAEVNSFLLKNRRRPLVKN